MDNEITVPVGYDIAWSAMLLLWIALTVSGLVSIVRSDLDLAGKAGWCAVVLLIPVLGAAVWFFLQRRRTRTSPTSG